MLQNLSIPSPPFCTLSGVVVHGKGNGKTVGMPTANLKPANGCHLPPHGVYATLLAFGASRYIGVTNVGNRPSVDQDDTVTVETYALDFNGDLYGQTISLSFYLFLRPVWKFDSLAAVAKQVEQDILRTRAFFGSPASAPAQLPFSFKHAGPL